VNNAQQREEDATAYKKWWICL